MCVFLLRFLTQPVALKQINNASQKQQGLRIKRLWCLWDTKQDGTWVCSHEPFYLLQTTALGGRCHYSPILQMWELRLREKVACLQGHACLSSRTSAQPLMSLSEPARLSQGCRVTSLSFWPLWDVGTCSWREPQVFRGKMLMVVLMAHRPPPITESSWPWA